MKHAKEIVNYSVFLEDIDRDIDITGFAIIRICEM